MGLTLSIPGTAAECSLEPPTPYRRQPRKFCQDWRLGLAAPSRLLCTYASLKRHEPSYLLPQNGQQPNLAQPAFLPLQAQLAAEFMCKHQCFTLPACLLMQTRATEARMRCEACVRASKVRGARSRVSWSTAVTVNGHNSCRKAARDWQAFRANSFRHLCSCAGRVGVCPESLPSAHILKASNALMAV